MRKNRIVDIKNEFSILTLDDDRLMTETLQSYFQSAGYKIDIENDPLNAIERLKSKEYDILLLDFLMRPICGDEVVREIRKYDKELFIILLTGHKSMAPPIKTIRELDIQGYYEKSERFDQLELLVESCTKSIRQMRIIRNYRDGLKKILDKVPELNCQTSTDCILEKTLGQLAELMPNHGCFAYFDLAKTNDNDSQDSNPNGTLFLGNGVFLGAEAKACRYFEDYYSDDNTVHDMTDEKLLLAPLFANQKQYGLLAVNYSADILNEDIQLFDIYSKQIGSLVSNLLLKSALQIQNNKLRDTYAAMRKNYMETIDLIRQTVDVKDYYTGGHSERVSFYSVLIANRMNKSETYVERIRIAGLFHDIGKMGIPDAILRKTGKLTDAEYSQLKEHPSLGIKILSSVSSFNDILPIIEAHHERIDGRGYPCGTSGLDIPEEARIISVADAFDAMTSKRVYRDALSLQEAINELQNCKGTQFDVDIVDIFLKILENKDEFMKQLSEAVISEHVNLKLS